MDEELRMKYRVPAWCPECKRLMKGSKSNNSYYDYGCCFDCFIEFIEGREERWKSGWRPDESRMKKFLDKMSRMR